MGKRPCECGCPCAAWADLLVVNQRYRVDTEAGMEPNSPLTFQGSDDNFLFFTRPNGDRVFICCEKIVSITELKAPA